MELQDEKYYSIQQLSLAKLHPFNNTREYLSKMINKDYHRDNLLKTIRKPWKSGNGYDYRIKGEDYKNFIAIQGYLKD